MKKNSSPFSTQNLPKIVQKNLQSFLIGGITVVVLLGTFVATQLTQSPQELRQQASVAGGPVTVTGRQIPSPFIADGTTQNQVMLSVNTGGVQIDGLELHFTISGDTNMSPVQSIVLQSADPNKGVFIGQGAICDNNTFVCTITATPDSNGVTNFGFAYLGRGIGYPLSTTTAYDFAKITFVNTLPGNVTFTYGTDSSAKTPLSSVDSSGGDEVLAPIQTMNFVAVAPQGATQSPTPTDVVTNPTDTPSPTQVVLNPTETPIVLLPTDTPLPTNTPVPGAPTATATPTPATGGATIKYCGESCSSNAECGVNLMCYSSVCRLANNPTDSYCNSPADNGIHRVCNEYCADSRECDTGLTCYYNRCRNPRNVSDQYCTNPISYVPPPKTQIVNKTVQVIVTATPNPFIPTQAPDAGYTNTTDYQVPAATMTPWPTYAPVSITPAPDDTSVTMIDRVQNWLKGLLILAATIGAVFFLLWLLPILMKKRRDDDEEDMTDDQLPPSRMS